MRHKALPFLLPALQVLPPLLSLLYGDLGYPDARARAESRFLRQVLASCRYTSAMLAPHLQAALSPWMRELVQAPVRLEKVCAFIARSTPASVQEALFWALSYEGGTRLTAAEEGGAQAGHTRDARVLFVPLVCEEANWSQTLPSQLTAALSEVLRARGIVQPDEAVLIAPPCLPPRALTRPPQLARLLGFALDGLLDAWGSGAQPAAELEAKWARWWTAPAAPEGELTLRSFELRFALLAVLSPEPSERVLNDLLPWQEEARTRLLLSDRFDSAALSEFDSETEIDAHYQSAMEDWVELVNGRVQDAELPIVVAGPPSDAYTACGRGVVEAAHQFAMAQEEAEETPLFVIADLSGVAVELGGASLRVSWAPNGGLLPAMLPVLAEVLEMATGRRVERSVVQDLNGLLLIDG